VLACSLLGMFIMISANNFLVIYLGLELLTLSATRWWRCAATTRCRSKRP
jgi:hypothetical protein